MSKAYYHSIPKYQCGICSRLCHEFFLALSTFFQTFYMTNTACQCKHKQFKANKSQLLHRRRMIPAPHKQPCEQQACFSESSWHWSAHIPWWIGQRLTASQLNDRLHSDSGDDHCLVQRRFHLVWSNEPKTKKMTHVTLLRNWVELRLLISDLQ